MTTKQAAQIADVQAESAYHSDPVRAAFLKAAGARTVINVPMLNKKELVGMIAIYRREVRPFTAKQIELVTNFASQAVIGIENTRLLNELRQTLQQQTATSEVLGVISRSPGELEPVFDAMLENALRICEAKFGMLARYSGGNFIVQALVGVPPALVDALLHKPYKPTPGIPLDRMLRTKRWSTPSTRPRKRTSLFRPN